MRHLAKQLVFIKNNAFLVPELINCVKFKICAKHLNGETLVKNNKMTPQDQFLFDLNGFIVVRNVLNDNEVNDMNNAIDENIDKARPRYVDKYTHYNRSSGSKRGILAFATSNIGLIKK